MSFCQQSHVWFLSTNLQFFKYLKMQRCYLPSTKLNNVQQRLNLNMRFAHFEYIGRNIVWQKSIHEFFLFNFCSCLARLIENSNSCHGTHVSLFRLYLKYKNWILIKKLDILQGFLQFTRGDFFHVFKSNSIFELLN